MAYTEKWSEQPIITSISENTWLCVIDGDPFTNNRISPLNLGFMTNQNPVIIGTATINGNMVVTGTTTTKNLVVTSTDMVTNLNAEMVGGFKAYQLTGGSESIPTNKFLELSGGTMTGPLNLNLPSFTPFRIYNGGETYFQVNAVSDNSNMLGVGAGQSSSNSFNSNFFGYTAGINSSDSYHSNFMGYAAGDSASNAHGSNFFGNSAGFESMDGYSSNFIGYYAGGGNANSYQSNFIGDSAGASAGNSFDSNFMGYHSGMDAIYSSNSNFIGRESGLKAFYSYNSNFIGRGSGVMASYSDNSIFIGTEAGSLTTGSTDSIFIGRYAGKTMPGTPSIGPNNIIIGTNISFPSGTTRSLNIGGVLFGTGLNNNYGSNPITTPIANGRIGVGIVKPQSTLDVNGLLTVRNGINVTGSTSESGYSIDAIGYGVKARNFKSTASTGIAPFDVTSQTKVENLNSDLLDGLHAYQITGITINAANQRYVDATGDTMNGNLIISKPGDITKMTITNNGIRVENDELNETFIIGTSNNNIQIANGVFTVDGPFFANGSGDFEGINVNSGADLNINNYGKLNFFGDTGNANGTLRVGNDKIFRFSSSAYFSGETTVNGTLKTSQIENTGSLFLSALNPGSIHLNTSSGTELIINNDSERVESTSFYALSIESHSGVDTHYTLYKTGNTPTLTDGMRRLNPYIGTTELKLVGHEATLQDGFEVYGFGYNNSPNVIPNGRAITVISGTTSFGVVNIIQMAIASNGGNMNYEVAGVTTEDIQPYSYGVYTKIGEVHDLDLSYFSVNDDAFLSQTEHGKFVKKSDLQIHGRSVLIGKVSNNSSTNGVISLNIVNEVSVLKNTSLEINTFTINDTSTGAFDFGGINITSPTQFSIGAVKGWIVDNESNPTSPDVKYVEYTGSTGNTTQFLTASTMTHIMLDNTSNIILKSTPPTPSERRVNIYLGKVSHPDKTQLRSAYQVTDSVLSPLSQIRDMFIPIPLINQGIQPYFSTGLTMYNTSGTLYGLGINFIAEKKNPNRKTILNGPASGTTFVYVMQTGGTTTATAIDPLYYDNNGVKTPVPSNNFTNQRIYITQNGEFVVQYAQKATYGSMTDAKLGLEFESFVTHPNLLNNAVLIGVLCVKNTATNLSISTDAQLTLASKFGELVGASGGSSGGGSSITTLQSAYEISSSPEIVTNNINKALTIKRGSGSDSDNLIELVNSAGSMVSGINAQGLVTGSTFTSTASTGTSPIKVSSTTKVDNLNVDMLDGLHVSDITGITVGVRNLLFDSSFNIYDSYGNSWNITNSDVLYGYPNNTYIHFTSDNIGKIESVSGITLNSGYTYTISFEKYETYVSSEFNFKLGNYSYMPNSNTTNFKRYEFTTPIVTGNTVAYFSIEDLTQYVGPGEENSLYIRNLKIEEGSKKTGWMPSPEDIFYLLNNKLDSNIPINADRLDGLHAYEVTGLTSAKIINQERATADAINELKSEIESLKSFISANLYSKIQVDELSVVNSLKYNGSDMFLTGLTAPSVAPDFIGQTYINIHPTTGGTTYQAKGITNSSDWKQTSN